MDKTTQALLKTKVEILENEIVEIDGMQILGISYPEQNKKQNLKEMIDGIVNFNSQKPSILLYHNPKEALIAKEMGINLLLAGHTHRGQLFPFQAITKLINGKYHYGFSKEDDFYAYTSSGVGTWGPAMRTSGRGEIVVISFK